MKGLNTKFNSYSLIWNVTCNIFL